MGSPFGRHAASAEEIATLGSEHDLRFFVDPLNPRNAYATVNTAYAAAIARLPAGTDVIIELAPNMIHAVAPALVVATDRNLVIKVAGEFLDSADLLTTSISGTITLPDASGEPARRNLFVTGLRMDLIVNQATSWNTIYKNLNFYGGLTLRTNGVNGCNTTLTGCRISSVSTMFRDADANAGLYVLIDTQVDVFATGAGPHTVFDMSAADETSFRFYSCNILLNNMMDVLSLINAGAPPSGMYIDFYDTTLDLDNFGGTSSIIENGNANIYTTWVNTTIFAPSGAIIIGVDDDDPVGWPKYVGENVPVNPKPGMLWVNPATGREAIYRMGTTYDYWQWSDWAEGYGFVDSDVGDATASTGSFDSITNATAVLDDVAAATVPIHLKLNEDDHDLAGVTLPVARHFALESDILSGLHNDYHQAARIFGTAVLPPADAGDRRNFSLIGVACGVSANVIITGGSNWAVKFDSCVWAGVVINRTNGANGCLIGGDNCSWNSNGLKIIDVDATGGRIALSNSYVSGALVIFNLRAGSSVDLINCSVWLNALMAAHTFIDGNSEAISVSLISTSFITTNINGTLPVLLNLAAGSIVRWMDVTFAPRGGTTVGLVLGNTGTHLGSPLIQDLFEPASIPAGTVWENLTLNTTQIWNGTYWGFNKSAFNSLNHSNVGATMIVAHTLITDTIYKIKAEIVGRLRDGPPSTEFRSVTLEATCTHLNGAAAAVVGAITSVHDVGNGGSAGWTLTLAANGDTIELQGTTGVAESCDWFAKISWEEIASLA